MASRPSGERDYYRLFGLSPTASTAEIVEAYRRLARRYHPDAATEESASSEMFKRITEAYGVLSDPRERRDYDRRRSQETKPDGFARESVTPSHGGRPSTAGGFGPEIAGRTVADIDAELAVSPEEARYGGLLDLTVTIPTRCRRCAGKGRIADAICGDCDGSGALQNRRRLRIALPRGVSDGSIIRLSDRGGFGPGAGGVLILRIRIQPCR
jgi:DnaJ-class molecular chaperone